MPVVTRTNLCTNPSFEAGITGWTAAGTPAPTIAQSAAQFLNRTKSLLITWAAGSTFLPNAGFSLTTVVGTQYAVSAWVYVPSGNPAVFLNVGGIGVSGFGATTTVFDAWVQVSLVFTANATSHRISIIPSGTPTAGQICYLDSALMEAAPVVASYFDGASSGCVWTGTADLSTSNQLDGPLSITVNNDLVNEPPRNIIYITGAPGSTAQITRTDADGAIRPVRGGDPAPLVSGRAVVYDYEVPYGVPVTYTVIPSDASANAFVTTTPLATTQSRLIHPGVPSLSVQIFGFHEDTTRGNDSGEAQHVILGRQYPQIITDGQRKSQSYTASVRTTTEVQNVALRAILAGSVPLLLQVVYPFTTSSRWEYLSISHVDERRISEQFGDPKRQFIFQVTVVDRPAGGIAAQRTWADLLGEAGTWQDVLNKYATWTGVLTGIAGT
jgi:hypothetical protein